MTRVSQNSSSASLQYALGKAKSRLEDLQLRGSTLKKITRPSDNPISNVESLAIGSSTDDNKQFLRNSDFALLSLNVTEKSLEQLTDILVKAKEIAIAQSSDLYNEDVRKNVANEVHQLKNLALSIANKRVGQKFIFSGFKTLTTPFDEQGNYSGDRGHSTLEVSKDFFVQVNLNGNEVFYSDDGIETKSPNPLEKFPELKESVKKIDKGQFSADDEEVVTRELASVQSEDKMHKRNNIFAQLDTLAIALENNDSTVIQDLLENFDESTGRLITLRTRVGSIISSISDSKARTESENIDKAERKSQLLDADVAELFSDITKQQALLKTTYQSSQGLINQTLMDFIR